ncbi:MAG: hypothetical protein H0X25_22885 [Acidobacteriales bacterium]|nr:hypothetical protein [Terriglobales bacterium]
MRTNIYLASAVAIVVTMALPAVSATDTSFRGALQGQEEDVLQGDPPDQILVAGELSGIADTVGRFTMTYHVTVSLPVGSSTGSAQLTAANGDTISTTIVGLGTQIANLPGINRIVEINTVTAGTGRFAGAQGSFTVERLANLADLAAVPTSGTFTGNIISPNSAR